MAMRSDAPTHLPTLRRPKTMFWVVAGLALALGAGEALAIPNCPPGYRVKPSYDAQGRAQPGGTCVPVGEPPVAKPAPKAKPDGAASPAVSPTAASPTRSAQPAQRLDKGCRRCGAAPGAPDFAPWLPVALLLLARHRRRWGHSPPP